MRRILSCLLFSLLLSSLSGTLACALAPVPIEGKLLVDGQIGTYFMEGHSQNITWLPSFPLAHLSPLGDRVVYNDPVQTGGEAHLWTADLDGSNPVNLTQVAGIGGTNCVAHWSPDASKIVFTHSDAVWGAAESPCEAGFHVWVINADGTGAHRVTPEASLPTWVPTWAPNGYRILCEEYWVDELDGIISGDTISIDEDGTDRIVLPDVGLEAEFSPDGSMIVSHKMWRDVVDEEPGYWRTLEVCDSDGTNPQVLLERFLTDSESYQHLDHTGWTGGVWGVAYDIGPTTFEWAPKGDRIALLLAQPFDPLGDFLFYQRQLWMYDLPTGQLTQVTDDSAAEWGLGWSGNNTFSDHPQVAVDNTTVTFDTVVEEGLTTIVRDDDPPEVPMGFKLDYQFYQLSTTATVTGPVTICMTYTEEDVPQGSAEEELAIFHWVEQGQYWEDITVSHDLDNNIICGETDSLSPIALYGVRHTDFSDVPAWGPGEDETNPHWAYYDIMACADAGIVGGYDDGTYQPTVAVSRDQMAVFISRALAGGDDSVPDGPTEATFNDVPTDNWACKYIEHCVANGVVQGYDPVTYAPTVPVSRAAMAVFISRAVAGGDDNVPDGPAAATFGDVPTDHWAYKYVEHCAAEEIVDGYDPDTYGPTITVSRDQMAVFISRAFDLPM